MDSIWVGRVLYVQEIPSMIPTFYVELQILDEKGRRCFCLAPKCCTKYISNIQPRKSYSNITPLYSTSSAPSNTFPIALCASSTPKNVAAFAGTALAIAGPIPGKNALYPPLL